MLRAPTQPLGQALLTPGYPVQIELKAPELGTCGFFQKNIKYLFLANLLPLAYFCASPIEKAHSQSYYLDRKCKKYHISLLKILKRYRKCPALIKTSSTSWRIEFH